MSAHMVSTRQWSTWAGTYILDACVYLFPNTNFALIDSDCVPVTLYEVQELWRSCDDFAHAAVPLAPDQTPTSPIAPAHKRARSVDTGKATQQPGPPAKLSKSRSVENLLSTPLRAPFPGSADNLVEEVDRLGRAKPSLTRPSRIRQWHFLADCPTKSHPRCCDDDPE